MSIPLLLLTASLAAPHPGVPEAPGQTSSALVPVASLTPLTPLTSVRFDEQRGEPQHTRSTGERPHSVGVGAQVAMSNRGVGGGMRFFFGERIGMNVSASWTRGGSGYTSAPQQGSTFAVMPSVVVMLAKPNRLRDVDIRPYVGAGVNYVSTSQPVTTTRQTNYALQQRSGTGGQAFGGAEMTFRDANMITISAEGIYYWLPVNYVNANVVSGFNYVLAFHFYLK